ncbi:hypothetical protein CDD83_3774 [Cordyceps sp. RAO-2017]|nr:hypothetical protein CDD83_3774 [Cordyceps sp. RAO-2017]
MDGGWRFRGSRTEPFPRCICISTTTDCRCGVPATATAPLPPASGAAEWRGAVSRPVLLAAPGPIPAALHRIDGPPAPKHGGRWREGEGDRERETRRAADGGKGSAQAVATCSPHGSFTGRPRPACWAQPPVLQPAHTLPRFFLEPRGPGSIDLEQGEGRASRLPAHATARSLAIMCWSWPLGVHVCSLMDGLYSFLLPPPYSSPPLSTPPSVGSIVCRPALLGLNLVPCSSPRPRPRLPWQQTTGRFGRPATADVIFSLSRPCPSLAPSPSPGPPSRSSGPPPPSQPLRPTRPSPPKPPGRRYRIPPCPCPVL